ncbi:MAG: choline dehydrogenase [Myxococcales bacterium]|nr:choline dehydrogenase [Myxococcales bacterium]
MAEYDYIVVGAGSAGCALAARLTEDPNCRVLLLEAGGSDRTAFCTKPGMISVVHTVPQVKKKFDWGYKTQARDWTLDRKIPYIRGRVMGGSSAINGMIFVRGNRANYDSWAAQGCTGWGFDDVLPYFKRLEDFEAGESDLRGAGGPVAVTRPKDCSPVSELFMEAVAEVTGVPRIEDYNGPTQEGVSIVQMSAKDGLRYSTSQAYLEPNRNRPNLTIVSRATVLKVNLEGTRAVGLDYQAGREVVTVSARCEVLLCGGVIGSAQILMLSGIGPAAHLAEHGIDCVADLPVGQNLHDHLFFPLVFLMPRGGHRGTPWHFFGGMFKEYLFGGGTWFGETVFEGMAFVKTSAGESIPNLQLHSLPWAYPAPNQDAPVRPKVDMRPALTVLPTMIYPKSRGEVRLRSADPLDAPMIDPHFLEDPADLKFLLDTTELTREIMASSAIAGEVTGELEPGGDYRDRAALAREMPNRVCTVYHPVGTCRMGVDERAVVDPELRVLGIQGLRVADASIMPDIIGGNTNAPSIMIGEKAADLLRAAQGNSA